MQTVPQRSSRFKFPRPADAVVILCLIACLGAVGLQAATQITTFDPPAATVGNARLLLLAVTQYTQDADELLPPMQTAAAFDAALRPYVPDPAVFVSRVTGKPFIPNAAISGQSLTSFSDLSTVAVFQDVLPPSNIPSTVGFLDGHVERSGVIQGDPKLLSISNAHALANGVFQYAQDNDETLPPTSTQTAFQTALLPYVQNSRLFIDPLNGKPFLPNPALSQVSLASISDPYTTVLLQSQMPYRNGIPTIAYMDGHVTPAQALSPGFTGVDDASNLKQIGLATIQYVQDYDEYYPTTTDYSTFESELLPYTKNSQIFVSPGSQLPYILNPAISGVSLASIDDPAATEEARDAQPNPDGTINYLELDGHVRQEAYFVPKALAIGPDKLIRILWPNANQQASLWTLTPGGTTKNTLDGISFFAQPTVGADDKTRILSGNTVEILGAGNSLESSTQFGPYDGWHTVRLATAPDNSSRLLWQHYNGALALWTLSPDGDFQGYVTVPTLAGGTPLGLGQGADGLTRLFWRTAGGGAVLWTVSPGGRVLRSYTARSANGFLPTALSLGADGSSRILSSDGAGSANLLTVAANGRTVRSVAFTLPGGGTASQVAVGSAGDLRVLWEASGGSGELQTLTPSGAQTSVQALTLYF